MDAQRPLKFLLVLMLVPILLLAGCASPEPAGDEENDVGDVAGTENGEEKMTIIFGDFSWDSALVHNQIAAFIVEHGYGYPVDYIPGDTAPIMQGQRRGDVHITMENWIDNYPDVWQELLDSGEVLDLGYNFTDGPQGIYVPTYVIEGDPERGIEPMAPDLESVFDLPEYWEVFQDPEVTDKGRFHNSPTGWQSHQINSERLKNYDLDEYYNDFPTGSQAALDTSIISAYNRGDPWLGSYWEPTWVMGQVDMTLLEEPEHDPERWEQEIYDTGWPTVDTKIGARIEVRENAPEIIEFLEKYETTLEQNNDFLAYMMETDADYEAAAVYFLQEYNDVWRQWVPDDIAENIQAALDSQ